MIAKNESTFDFITKYGLLCRVRQLTPKFKFVQLSKSSDQLGFYGRVKRTRCEKTDQDQYTMQLANNLPLEMWCNTVIHEAAHIIADQEEGEWNHGEAWGKRYAYVYRKAWGNVSF